LVLTEQQRATLTQASRLARRGELRAAVVLLRREAAAGPSLGGCPATWTLLARYHQRLGDYSRAKEAAHLAICYGSRSPGLEALVAQLSAWPIGSCIVDPKRRLVCLDIPKVASSSIKAFIWQLRNGRRFDGDLQRAHRIYWPRIHGRVRDHFADREAGWWRVAIIRDPVRRLVSAWRNRIAHHRVLERPGVGTLSLDRQPDLDQFVSHLGAYQRASRDIRWHTTPQSVHLGNRLDRYDAIFPIERLGEFERLLCERYQAEFALPHLQDLGPKASANELSATAYRQAVSWCRADYALLGRYYSPER
jgi:hypothetical protein